MEKNTLPKLNIFPFGIYTLLNKESVMFIYALIFFSTKVSMNDFVKIVSVNVIFISVYKKAKVSKNKAVSFEFFIVKSIYNF